MADGAQANPKGFRKKALVRRPSGWRGSDLRASFSSRTSRSSLAMKLFAIAILAGSILPTAHSSLFNLKSMVEAITGKSAILSFVGYGCYCGLGGGGQPMDEVDWCCHAHDCCYQKLFDQGCHTYVDHYQYTIENNTTIVCRDLNQTDCDRQTCECDKSVTLCFQRHKYNEKHRNYLNIYCQGTTPNCSIYEQPRGSPIFSAPPAPRSPTSQAPPAPCSPTSQAPPAPCSPTSQAPPVPCSPTSLAPPAPRHSTSSAPPAPCGPTPPAPPAQP